jgi:hypothetical protein
MNDPKGYIANQQRRYPLDNQRGYDFGLELYDGLRSRLPSSVRELFERGVVAIGEVGVNTFNAVTTPVADGFAIQIYSGVPKFIYRVGRMLWANFAIRSSKVVAEQSLSLEESASLIASTVRRFVADATLDDPKQYSISPEQIVMASSLATHAEAFVVAHEIRKGRRWTSIPH